MISSHRQKKWKKWKKKEEKMKKETKKQQKHTHRDKNKNNKHSFVVHLQHYGALRNLGNGHQWHTLTQSHLDTSLSQ